jgi:hypothetical protein
MAIKRLIYGDKNCDADAILVRSYQGWRTTARGITAESNYPAYS